MATVPLPQFRREDLKPGESLCEHCTAKCCHYYALPIDSPDCVKDFDYMRWYLIHGDTGVFTENDTWYILVWGVCRHLQPDYRCGIYETRPEICREYSTDNCEWEDKYVYDRYFEDAQQVAEFSEAMFPSDDPDAFRSPKPPLLPILS